MEDPLKPQLNYSQALAHIKDRQASLVAQEKDLAERHERLLSLEKSLDDTRSSARSEIDVLEREKRTLKGDLAKAQLMVENEHGRLKDAQYEYEAEISKLTTQVSNLEASFNLNFGRNEELAKAIRAKEVELGAKRQEVDELITYHKDQEKSVQAALDGYNDQLHASSTRLGEIQQEIATNSDQLETVKDEVVQMTQFAEKERTNLETELTSLEEQRDRTSKQLEEVSSDLHGAQSALNRAQAEYDKTLVETEDLIKKGLIERKATAESRALLKKVEADASDERRRLQSDRAVYGKL